jgi:hypothetical protein
MRALALLVLLLQFGQRPALTPAETLLEPSLLRNIDRSSVEGKPVAVINGTDAMAGEIVLACQPPQCEAVEWAMKRITNAEIPRPARTIRSVSTSAAPPNTKTAIFIAESKGRDFQVIRGLWSTAGIADEVVEMFGRHAVAGVNVRGYENVGQPRWEDRGIPITAIVPPADATGLDRASAIAATSAYFLATLPNAGAEALLSHLTVGAHARLAEDGRRAVALMGNQQRASADVLVTLGHAIDREQRRMRNFERFMPEPVDPMLRSRIAEMERGITSVWTSMGITSSPYMPPAERLRGRAGEDRRVPSRTAAPLKEVEPPTALAKHPQARDLVYEMIAFVDGKRSISDIRDAVSAEFGAVPLPAVVAYFETLDKAGAVSVR